MCRAAKQKFTTSVAVDGGCNPAWTEKNVFKFVFPDRETFENENLWISIKNKNKFSDSTIATAKLPWRDLMDYDGEEHSWPVLNDDDEEEGTLRVFVSIYDPVAIAEKEAAEKAHQEEIAAAAAAAEEAARAELEAQMAEQAAAAAELAAQQEAVAEEERAALEAQIAEQEARAAELEAARQKAEEEAAARIAAMEAEAAARIAAAEARAAEAAAAAEAEAARVAAIEAAPELKLETKVFRERLEDMDEEPKTVEIPIEEGYKLIGGGFDLTVENEGKPRSFACQSSPNDDGSAWMVRTSGMTAKLREHSVVGSAIGIFDPDDQLEVNIATATGPVGEDVIAEVPEGFLLVGGGWNCTFDDSGRGGIFASASHPSEGGGGWLVHGTQKGKLCDGEVTCFAISVKPPEGVALETVVKDVATRREKHTLKKNLKLHLGDMDVITGGGFATDGGSDHASWKSRPACSEEDRTVPSGWGAGVATGRKPGKLEDRRLRVFAVGLDRLHD